MKTALFIFLFFGASLANAGTRELILWESIVQGVDPKVALAVAQVESGLNPRAVGSHGEIGLFQRLQHPPLCPTVAADVRQGLTQLRYWQKRCPVRDQLAWLNCYNAGFRRPRYPYLMPYYKKVMEAMK